MKHLETENEIQSELFDKKYEILMKEWGHLQVSINNLDEQIFKIRGWAVMTTSVVLGYAFTRSDQTDLPLYWIIVICAFWFIDALFKSFQLSFIDRSRAINEYLSSKSFEEAVKMKSFGNFIIPNYSLKSREGGANFGRTKYHLKTLFIRNVFLSYLMIFIVCISTWALLYFR